MQVLAAPFPNCKFGLQPTKPDSPDTGEGGSCGQSRTLLCILETFCSHQEVAAAENLTEPGEHTLLNSLSQ